MARAIHDHGHRSGKPFVAVNCAAIPAELMESELFGHVRGAFTGAVNDRKGAFREAEHGTLLLDEIGDMGIGMQAKILRALQERIVTPVGGKPVPIDVRVIAATHRDLKQRVRDGSFREDLFYRLHVVPIGLPPLRERIADILPLAERFLGMDGGGKHLTPDAAARLVRHPWPGNVRELKNAMERAAVLVRGVYVNAADLDFIEAGHAAAAAAVEWPDEDLPSATARLEELLIRRALARGGGNRAEAARLLGIHRQLLYAKMKRYGPRCVRRPDAKCRRSGRLISAFRRKSPAILPLSRLAHALPSTSGASLEEVDHMLPRWKAVPAGATATSGIAGAAFARHRPQTRAQEPPAVAAQTPLYGAPREQLSSVEPSPGRGSGRRPAAPPHRDPGPSDAARS